MCRCKTLYLCVLCKRNTQPYHAFFRVAMRQLSMGVLAKLLFRSGLVCVGSYAYVKDIRLSSYLVQYWLFVECLTRTSSSRNFQVYGNVTHPSPYRKDCLLGGVIHQRAAFRIVSKMQQHKDAVGLRCTLFCVHSRRSYRAGTNGVLLRRV